MSHLRLHSFTGATDHDFTGLIAGQALVFDGTNIVTTATTSTSGDLWSASTGTNSIIANNGTGNIAGGQESFVAGRGNTITNTPYAAIAGGYNNFISGALGNFLHSI